MGALQSDQSTRHGIAISSEPGLPPIAGETEAVERCGILDPGAPPGDVPVATLNERERADAPRTSR